MDGVNASFPIRKVKARPMGRQLTTSASRSSQRSINRFLGIEEEQSKFKVNDQKARAEAEFKRLQFLFSHVYLGCLAHDSAFLHHLYENPEKLESPNKETIKLLRDLIARNHRRAIRRQNVLRMRRPLYVMMFQRKRLPPGYKRTLNEEKKLRRHLIVIEVNFLLHRLHEIRMRKDYIRTVDRVKDKFDSYSLKIFPAKKKCLNASRGRTQTHVICPRYRAGKYTSENILETSPKNSNGGTATRQRHWLDKSVEQEEGSEELPQTSHGLRTAGAGLAVPRALEISDSHDLARFYIKKAQDMGQEAGNEQWILNSQPVHSDREQLELSERGERGGSPGLVQLQEFWPRLARRLVQERDRRHGHGHGKAVGVQRDRGQATADIELDVGRHEGRGGLLLQADGRYSRRSTTIRDAQLQAPRLQAALQEEDDTFRSSERSGETSEESPIEVARQEEAWLHRFRRIRQKVALKGFGSTTRLKQDSGHHKIVPLKTM
ncbi:hypothetical protein E2986_11266 [Frieseomelitta varia]|uniref:Uncharacterized protein n=1 Tax=Frieseomelitta varia TaxID=561572 RepID=A0A833VS41_9HYME|nr:hypothetical protein E2986_11266 [Frieseomelitta varia]